MFEAIRKVEFSDLKALITIEQETAFNPWSERSFEDCFNVGYHMYLLEQQGVVAGFVIFSNIAEEAHILNIAVAKNFQGRGFGQALLQYAIDKAVEEGAVIMLLEVATDNFSAIHIYSKHDFVAIGLREAYYRSGPISKDAYVFAREL